MNSYIISCIILFVFAILVWAFWARAIFFHKTTKWYIIMCSLCMGFGLAAGLKGGRIEKQKSDMKTYTAWVKHTKNPGHLTLEEWQDLNRNYVPRGKHDRREPATE